MSPLKLQNITDAGSETSWINSFNPELIQDVESRIMRQLLESLLYERIIPYEHNSSADGEDRLTIPVRTANGEPASYVCRGKIKNSFGRIRIRRQSIMRLSPDGTQTTARLSEFVTEALGNAECEERLPGFFEELVQTLVKDTQAHFFRQTDPLPNTALSYDDLEAHIIDGHPYHPCYKSRIGFSLVDNASFGPEFRPEIRPIWLAVAKHDCTISTSDSIDYEAFIRHEIGEETVLAFHEKIIAAGGDPETFRLLAVHPWQWREITGAAFYRQLSEDRIIWLGESKDAYRPQQSIRTLANRSNPEKSYLKLPLSITNTSTGRILARHTILNAPLISDWLYKLVEGDPAAKQTGVIVLREVAGVAFDHDTITGIAQSKAYGTLGLIWRESLQGYLSKGEEGVPFNGLCHIEANGHPLIRPWVERYGIRTWTEALLRASVIPVIHMLFAHGVALESHAQNMIFVHRNGMPVRVALKDFHDGIRFSRSHLSKPDECPVLHPVPAHHPKINRNSFIETDDPSVVRDFVHDAFFFINLAELAMFLEEHFGLAETEFWGLTAGIIREYESEHPQYGERFRLFDLFAETIQVEQLTKRRLFGDAEFRVQDVPNPLGKFR